MLHENNDLHKKQIEKLTMENLNLKAEIGYMKSKMANEIFIMKVVSTVILGSCITITLFQMFN